MKKFFSLCLLMLLVSCAAFTANAKAPKLNKATAVMQNGKHLRLEADQEVEWYSMNSRVAEVDSDGKVTATGYGEVKIAALNKYGEFSFCDISVKNYSVEKTGHSKYPYEVTVNYGKNKSKTYRVYNKLASRLSAIRARGCSHSSIATVLSAYGYNITPEQIYTGSLKEKYSERYARYKATGKKAKGNSPLAVYAISSILKNAGISNKAVYSFNKKEAVREITANLKKGRPVIVMINGRGNGKVSFSNWFHYVTLAGIDEKGNAIVLDSIGGLVNESKKTGKYELSVKQVVRTLMKSAKGGRTKSFYYKNNRSYGGYVLIKE